MVLNNPELLLFLKNKTKLSKYYYLKMPLLNFFGQPVSSNDENNKSVEETKKKQLDERKEEENPQQQETEETENKQQQQDEWIDAGLEQEIEDNKLLHLSKEQEQESTVAPADNVENQQEGQEQNDSTSENNLINQEAEEEQQQQQPTTPENVAPPTPQENVVQPFRLHPIEFAFLLGLLMTRHYKIFSFASIIILRPLVMQSIASWNFEKLQHCKNRFLEKNAEIRERVGTRVKNFLDSLGTTSQTQTPTTPSSRKNATILIVLGTVIIFAVLIIAVFNLSTENQRLHQTLSHQHSVETHREKVAMIRIHRNELLEKDGKIEELKKELDGLKTTLSSTTTSKQKEKEKQQHHHQQQQQKQKKEVEELKLKVEKEVAKNNEAEKQVKELKEHLEALTQKKTKVTTTQQGQQEQQQQTSSSSCGGSYKKRCSGGHGKKSHHNHDNHQKQNENNNNNKKTTKGRNLFGAEVDDDDNHEQTQKQQPKKRKFRPLTALGEFLNPFMEWQLDFEL